MPSYLTPYIVEEFFQDQNNLNFYTYAINLFAYRLYITASFQVNN